MANEINIDINDDNEDITISTDETVNNVSETVGGDPYYTDLAREWATKEGSKVLGIDYSSKYYATQAKADREHIDNIITDNIDAINTLEANLDTITAVANDLDNINNASVSAENAEIWAEGTDEEVQALGGTHSAKVWANNVAQGLTGKVNKSGDTMTGNLTIQKDTPVLTMKDTLLTLGNEIYTNSTIVRLLDKDNVLCGELRHQNNNDGSHYIDIVTRKSSTDNNTYSLLKVGFSAAGNAQATAVTPPASSNGIDIATTAWVRNYGVNKQDTLISGTNIKTLNGISLLGSGNIIIEDGGGSSNEVFIAEYQVTPAQDIFDAIDAGKTVLCKKAFSNGYDYYSLGRYSPSYPGAVFYLERNYNVYSINVYIENNADVWRASDVTVADKTLSNVTSANIISALGYTPYNATNPNGYITGITSSNVTNALGYTPVNKAGDTMSGRLTASGVTSTNNIEINFDTSVSKGTIPTTTKYRGFSINDGDSSHSAWQEKRFGLIECQLNTDGSSVITVSALKNQANSTSGASLVLGMPQSGSAYCTFPNTTCVDGQWVSSYSQIANAVSLPNTDAITYDLSGYLPADSNSYDYEVYVTGNVISGATSGNIAVLSIQGALIADVCGAITRTNSSTQARGTVVMPILHNNRNLIIRAITNNTGTFSLQFRGYRRLGTNA